MPPPGSERVPAIDMLRGLVMALMALDHARDFFMGFEPSPTDLESTTPWLFATRWITHLCAPAFILLAGVSAGLAGRMMSRRELARFLALRGAVLVALEITVVTFAWIPDPSRNLILLQVIWAIGWSMMLTAPMAFASKKGIAAVGAAMVLSPIWLAGLGLGRPGDASGTLAVLAFANQALEAGGGTTLIISYPILPWWGVMLLGLALSDVLAEGREVRVRRCVMLGAVATAAFVVLRVAGLDGDPTRWAMQGDGVRSVIAFLNAEKYPPSPAYLLMTLGPALLLLALFGAWPGRAGERWLAPLGRAPLFFYVLHLYALRAAGLACAALVWGVDQLGPPPQPSTPEWPLWSVWLVWGGAMAALFPPTRWVAELKRRRRGWLTRLL